jgi:hypothetical protein
VTVLRVNRVRKVTVRKGIVRKGATVVRVLVADLPIAKIAAGGNIVEQNIAATARKATVVHDLVATVLAADMIVLVSTLLKSSWKSSFPIPFISTIRPTPS